MRIFRYMLPRGRECLNKRATFPVNALNRLKLDAVRRYRRRFTGKYAYLFGR